MSLFQQTIVEKHLKSQDKEQLAKKWTTYKNHFLNPEIQENIRNSKEEQYQGEFLIDLFVNVLGYIKNPNPNFNLITEQKNAKNAKKADGAILINGSVKAVIELKGTNTPDLSNIELQAFGYKNNQPNCTYIITSNYEKLRFYIDNAIEYQEFDLFKLTKPAFELLYLCLAYENIQKDVPLKIKKDSLSREDDITKKLYKDYSVFKRALFTNLTELNPQQDALLLFKKSQKLLDRFLFLFFAEDSGLLPPNTVRMILQEWKDLQELDAYTPLYHRYKKHFGYLNTGFKGKQYEVFAYNGGLFKPDEVLDNIKIDDELLYEHTLKISEYNFKSEVDVNILGHIFENSLNEIEEVQAQLLGGEVDKSNTKRKKDGVFYTPKYITKYIVENTVGKLCAEKKEALGINPNDYTTDKKRQKKTIKAITDKLKDYRAWLLQLTICDPACGSGAFLNEALSFLISEHKVLDELEIKVSLGGNIQLQFVENTILENNLFGVDINEESVEIAKLSLWLRTAKPNRKLNNLNNNIKCGNSLIDDPTIAGDKAFNWQQEFPQVFREKNKKAFHITTALHDSRTSERMIEYRVRKRRDGGGNPLPNYTFLTQEEEVLITKEIIEIAENDQLNIMAFNVCGDHIHLLLVCEEESVPSIMQKIKSKTARSVNIAKGITREHALMPDTDTTTREHALMPDTDTTTREHALLPNTDTTTREHAPLLTPQHAPLPIIQHTPLPLQRGSKQNSLCTQKFGCKIIDNETQLHNTINYIKNNREKHELPPNKEMNSLVQSNVLNCSYKHAFRNEYTGGFDVVIGNPPYVRKQGLMEHYPEMCVFFEKKYKSATASYDIYALFMERSFGLINPQGFVSFILPHKFLVTDFGEGIRQFFKENTAVKSIVHFGSKMVFSDASTYTCIVTIDKTEKEKVFFKKLNPIQISTVFEWDYMLYKNLDSSNWDLQNQRVFDVIEKLKKQPYTIDEVFLNIFQGLATSLDAVYVFEGQDKGNYIDAYNSKFDYHFEIEKELVKPILGGKDVQKYQPNQKVNYVFVPYKTDGSSVSEEYIKDKLPKTYSYIKHFETEIRGRERGRMDIENGWFLYIYPKNIEKFPLPKIMTREISLGCNMTYDEKGEFYHNTKVYSFLKSEKFKVDDKFYLGIFNSKVLWFFLKNTGSEYRGGYFVFTTNYLKPFPLPELPENPNLLINKVNEILASNKDLQELSAKFQRTLQRKFFTVLETREHAPLPDTDHNKTTTREHAPLPKKLQKWYDLSFSEFIKELGKKKVNLSLAQESEWEDYFLEVQEKALALKNQIDTTDAQIDAMVYELYGLSEEEIRVVESS